MGSTTSPPKNEPSHVGIGLIHCGKYPTEELVQHSTCNKKMNEAPREALTSPPIGNTCRARRTASGSNAN